MFKAQEQLTELTEECIRTVFSLSYVAATVTSDLSMSRLPSYGSTTRDVVLVDDCKLGAQTIIHLAVSEDVENISGKYFIDCKEAECSKLGTHRGMAKKLWLASELDVKLEPEDVHKFY
ncbi:hypothetical protein Pcinc_022548 [Petrolisthes cinctipes]|uniref:Uncharacterized protein n=1 Tax=Petrolisthes cinctipes TaxID=88211 RepID=A0AAE1FFB5_PETCI|nr:hypothetical protein Pcinc_022548 [Petrolisthes cinctipes]